MRRVTTLCALAAVCAILLASSSCKQLGLSEDWRPNDGSTLTTKPGDPIEEKDLLGKWDLNGELTNRSNGFSGILAIPSNIITDTLGDGWKFEPEGVLLIDTTLGADPAMWKLDGNKLTVNLPGMPEPPTYEAHFNFGYLYLKGKDEWKVFEKNMFFGF